MSGLINKVKEALHGDKTTNPEHSTTGHHSTTSGYNTTGTGVGSTGAGPHDSSVANKLDPRVDSNNGATNTGYGNGAGYGNGGMVGGQTGYGQGHHTTTGTGVGSTGAGPHSSSLANKLDPRVDSNNGATNPGYGNGAGYGNDGMVGGPTGYGQGHHTTTGTGVGSTGAGPHSSSLANKLDPRVDSNTGTTNTGYGTTGNSTGYGSATGSSNVGPHSSNLANKVDPRVESGGYSTSERMAGTGTTGGISRSTNAGPHNSNMANKLDPRVDSDLDGRGSHATHGHHGTHATPGSGSAQNTAGPHSSDLLNKLDPRVDSDLDGSRTIGGNRTRTSGLSEVDTHDAAKVPPSVFAAHHGEPIIEHDDHTHNRAGRHGSTTYTGSEHYGSGAH